MMSTSLPSTRPYLIRALHQWCTDHGFTPYLSVAVDGTVRVPKQHVVDGEVVLNIGTEATGGLSLGDEFIEFKARFSGVVHQIVVPIERVAAIYARENGQGMAFPVLPGQQIDQIKAGPVPEQGLALVALDASTSDVQMKTGADSADVPPAPRPTLTRIK